MSKYYWIITDVGNGLGLDEDVGTSSHDSKKKLGVETTSTI